VIDDVLGFEVAVDYLTLMHVVKGTAYLLDYYLSHLFCEFSLLLEEGVELP
jgi:hypothetical protein